MFDCLAICGYLLKLLMLLKQVEAYDQLYQQNIMQKTGFGFSSLATKNNKQTN